MQLHTFLYNPSKRRWLWDFFFWKHLSITLRSSSLIIPFAARVRVQGVQPQGRKRRSHGARWRGILVQGFVLLLPDRSQIMSWNLCLYFSWEFWMCLDYVYMHKYKGLHLCVYVYIFKKHTGVGSIQATSLNNFLRLKSWHLNLVKQVVSNGKYEIRYCRFWKLLKLHRSI